MVKRCSRKSSEPHRSGCRRDTSRRRRTLEGRKLRRATRDGHRRMESTKRHVRRLGSLAKHAVQRIGLGRYCHLSGAAVSSSATATATTIEFAKKTRAPTAHFRCLRTDERLRRVRVEVRLLSRQRQLLRPIWRRSGTRKGHSLLWVRRPHRTRDNTSLRHQLMRDTPHKRRISQLDNAGRLFTLLNLAPERIRESADLSTRVRIDNVSAVNGRCALVWFDEAFAQTIHNQFVTLQSRATHVIESRCLEAAARRVTQQMHNLVRTYRVDQHGRVAKLKEFKRD